MCVHSGSGVLRSITISSSRPTDPAAAPAAACCHRTSPSARAADESRLPRPPNFAGGIAARNGTGCGTAWNPRPPHPRPARRRNRTRHDSTAGSASSPGGTSSLWPRPQVRSIAPLRAVLNAVRVRAPSLPGARLARPAPGVVALPRLPVSGSSRVRCSAGEAEEPLEVSVRAARLWASHPA